MIHVDEVPEPEGFREEVAVPGERWLANHDVGRPPAYWARFRTALADGFADLCGYSAMYVPVGTVDHFVSIHEDRGRAYDWTNYRFAADWMNSCKSGVPSAEILDPYVVQDGWFEILLPSLHPTVAGHRCIA